MPNRRHPRRLQGPIGIRLRIGVLLSLAAAGCGELEPCPGARTGVGFEIEVLAPKNPEVTCHALWDLGPGALLQGTIVDLRGEYDCKAGVPEFGQMGDWRWTIDNEAEVLGGSTLEGRYTITDGTCSAWLWLFLVSEPAFDCSARNDDLCLVEVRITPRDSTCPTVCSGELNVRAERL